MTREELVILLRSQREWVQASIAEDGRPQAAVIGVAVADDLRLVFDTLASSRKSQNLRRDPRIALTMWSGARTAQIEGTVREPRGTELEALKQVYFATFKDGPDRQSWEGITYFQVIPTWIRVTDFGSEPPDIQTMIP